MSSKAPAVALNLLWLGLSLGSSSSDPRCQCIPPVARGYLPLIGGYVDYVDDGSDTTYSLPANYGSSCEAWDMPMNINGLDPWGCDQAESGGCLDTWCYVDPCDCAGAQDASQTMMFASTYATATRLAYSYDTCARCYARTTEGDCAGHTRCAWDAATATCQTSTTDEYTATRCADVNQRDDWEAACDERLNCKAEGGRCAVRTSEERASAWACGRGGCKCISPPELGYIPLQNDSLVYVDGGSGTSYHLPANYGSGCTAWDMPEHMNSLDPWGCVDATDGGCLDTWCYVDPCRCTEQDASQTMMFASTYPTATRLAYSYNTCAQCSDQSTAQACAAHTRCSWDAVTSTCQTSTSDEYTAIRCEDVNQQNDWEVVCNERLNCKIQGGRCVVRTSTERAQAWECTDNPCACIEPVARGYLPLIDGRVDYVDGGSDTTFSLPASYGSSCEAWDMPANMGGLDPWGCDGAESGGCLDTWCYVDPCRCEGARDASQTMMFASTYPMAARLAYSYDTCANCFGKTSEQACGGHTRCVWDAITATCQTSTTDDYTATRCEDVNQREDWEFACIERLNCKVEAGRCVVRTAEERNAVWACGDDRCKCISPLERGYVPLTNGSIVYVDGGSGANYNLPSTYGASCAAWDMPDNMNNLDPWGCASATSGGCLDTWCYVDPCECSAAKDVSQTMMFATTYGTATLLAYSYDACAQCYAREAEAGCGTHTRCTWETATSTCQTSTSDEYTAIRCEDVNQGDDWEAVCEERLNCKIEGGRCVVATSEERAAAWQCSALERPLVAADTSMCYADACATISGQQCFATVADQELAQLRHEAEVGNFHPTVAYRDRASSRLAAQVFRIVATELLGAGVHLQDLGSRAEVAIFGDAGDFVASENNDITIDLDLELRLDRLAGVRYEYQEFAVRRATFDDLGNIGYDSYSALYIAGRVSEDVSFNQLSPALSPSPSFPLVGTATSSCTASYCDASGRFVPPQCQNNTCYELWSLPSSPTDASAVAEVVERFDLPFVVSFVTADVGDLLAALDGGRSAVVHVGRLSLAKTRVGDVQVFLPAGAFARVPAWKAASKRLRVLSPALYQLASNLHLASTDVEEMLSAMADRGAGKSDAADSQVPFAVACNWTQHHLATIKSWLPICTGTQVLRNGRCVRRCPSGQEPDARAPSERCVTYALGSARACVAGSALSIPRHCRVALGSNDSCAEEPICIDSAGEYEACPVGRAAERFFALRTGWSFAQTSVNCVPCPVGTFSSAAGRLTCEPVPAGFFAPMVGSTSASPCPKGTYTPGPGYPQCLLCSVGTFQDTEGWSQCKTCINGTTTDYPDALMERGAVGNYMCGCPSRARWVYTETVRIAQVLYQMGRCESCIEGLHCAGGRVEEIVILAGYWSSAAGPLSIFKCQTRDMCPGGPPDTCASNREGIACGNCERKHFPVSDGSCTKCTAVDFLPSIFILAACFLGTILVFVFANVDASQQKLATATVVLCMGQLAASMQALGAFQQIEVNWEGPMKNLLSVLDLMVFDLRVARVSCVLQADDPVFMYVLRLLVYPLLVLFLLVILSARKALLKRPFDLDAFFNTNGLILLVLHISLTISVLLPFQCSSNPNGTSSLIWNPSVVCWDSDQHSVLIGAAVVGILVYPVTVLVLTIRITLLQPYLIASGYTMHMVRRYRFLFARFKTECYFYGVVYLVRNSLVALVPVVFTGAPVAQVLAMGTCLLFFGGLQNRLWPWRTEFANLADLVMSLGLTLCMLGAALLVSVEEQDGETALSMCVFTSLMLMPVVALGIVTYFLITYFRTVKTYGAFLCHHKATTAVLARFLKLFLANMSTSKVFLDSDELEDLDLLFDTVRSSVDSLVILLNRQLLERIWCAGELVTAMKNQVPVVPLTLENYVPPDEEFLDNLDAIWDNEQKHTLLAYGITVDAVKVAFRQLGPLEAVPYPGLGNRGEQVAVIQKLAERCGLRMKALRTSRIEDSATTGNAELLIFGCSTDLEARCTCEVLRFLMQTAVQEVVQVAFSVDDVLANQASATVLIAVLTRGVLEDLGVAQIVLHSFRKGTWQLVTVLADPAFAFPNADCFSRLRELGLGKGASAVSPEDGADLAEAYQCLAKVLAQPLSPYASHALLSAQVAEVCLRASRANSKQCNTRFRSGGGQRCTPAAGKSAGAAAPAKEEEVPGADDEVGFSM